MPKNPDRHKQDWTWESSAGVISGGVVTNPSGATIRVSAGTGLIRSEDDSLSPLKYFSWAQTDIDFSAVADNTAHHVYVTWNSGSPTVTTTTDESTIDEHSEFEVATVIKETPTGGSTTYHIHSHARSLYDVPARTQHMLEEVFHVRRANKIGGLILDESGDGNRYVTVSAGELYQALNEYDISAIDTSGADSFDRYYRDGSGGWKAETGQTTWPNGVYDDNSGTLVALTGNFHSSLWFYMEVDNQLTMLYGQDEFATIAEAEADTPPASVPPRLEEHAILLGRIIFQKAQTTAEEVQSAFDTVFQATAVTDHGNLAGLTDDDHSQYALLAGRSGGQTQYGDTAADGDYEVHSTSNATRGDVILGDGLTLVDEDHGVFTANVAGVSRETDQSINNAATTEVNFTATFGDRSTWAEHLVDNYILPTVAGWYGVFGYSDWDADPNNALMQFSADGTGTIIYGATQNYKAAGGNTHQAFALAYFDGVDDRITLNVRQTSGGPINLTLCYLSIARMGF